MPAFHEGWLRITTASMLVAISGWIAAEIAFASPRLSQVEMKRVVGGISGCELFSQELRGYKCGNFRTMACTLICSPCAQYPSQVQCEIKNCWGCMAGGVEDQLKECVVGTEQQNCDTFGDGLENGVCGNMEQEHCRWNGAENRCYCDPPLDDMEVSCPRKDCANF